MRDTCNLLADGIVKLLRALAAVEGSDVKGWAAQGYAVPRLQHQGRVGHRLGQAGTGGALATIVADGPWSCRGSRRLCRRAVLSGRASSRRRSCWGSCCSRTGAHRRGYS